MDHVVAKEFKTVDRKFAAGDPVSESDIHPEGLLSFEDWKNSGFVTEVKAASNAKALPSAIELAPENPDH